MTDYPQARPMMVNEQRVFIDHNTHKAIIIHKTASPGMTTAESIAQYFATNSEEKSSHYVVDDNEIIQCVLEKDGAAANCCPDSTHNPIWNNLIPQYPNLNWCTLSIENVDPSPDNSTPLSASHKALLFPLVVYLMRKYNIPKNMVLPHSSINATQCPNVFPWNELYAYIDNAFSASLSPNKEDIDMWSALIDTPHDTAIFTSWLKAYRLHNHVFGPPIKPESLSVNRDGTPIKILHCLYARAEHYYQGNLSTHWYDARGEIGEF